jgi:hypothetical protein
MRLVVTRVCANLSKTLVFENSGLSMPTSKILVAAVLSENEPEASKS